MSLADLKTQHQAEKDAAMAKFVAIGEQCEREERERTEAEHAEVQALVDQANKTRAEIARLEGED